MLLLPTPSPPLSLPYRKERFQKHVLQWMSDPKLTDEVRDIWMGYWDKVDANLGQELRSKLPEKIKMSAKAFAPAGPAHGVATGGTK